MVLVKVPYIVAGNYNQSRYKCKQEENNKIFIVLTATHKEISIKTEK